MPDKLTVTFGIPSDHPLREEHLRLATFLATYEAEFGKYIPFGERNPVLVAAWEEILSEERERDARTVAAAIERLLPMDLALHAAKSAEQKTAAAIYSYEEWQRAYAAREALFGVVKTMLQRKLPLTHDQCRALLEWCGHENLIEAQYPLFLISSCYPISTIAKAAEQFIASEGLTRENAALLDRILARLTRAGDREKQSRNLMERLSAFSHASGELRIEAGEAWADVALRDVRAQATAGRFAWIALIGHARESSGASPTRKWLKACGEKIETVGKESFRANIVKWFNLVDRPRLIPALSEREWRARCAVDKFSGSFTQLIAVFDDPAGYRKMSDEVWKEMWEADDPWAYLRNLSRQPTLLKYRWRSVPVLDIPAEPPPYAAVEDQLIPENNMDILRGLAWMCGLQEDRELARALVTLALSAYRKVPGKGPRAVRVGNACITALGMMPGLDAVGQLALLKVKVKFGTAQIAIEKALTAAAEREGLPREELEEMSVPAYGLTEVGRLVETLGEFTAELTVAGTKSVELVWRRADGRVQKSLPAAVKKEFSEELKELNAAKKDIEKMLPAQAERIDALFLQQKTWPLETWLERYLEHPLVGTLARRLIWNFTTDGTTTPGLWLDGKLVDRLGHAVPLDAGRTTVAFWHPLDQPPDVVLGWRAFLEEWQIVQPFKQAHREVYVLTPAEERTGTYSNRFAAHILKQHQFHALCAARGWKNKLRLMVDDEYPPATRLLPLWGLRAEFWIEGAGSEYGADTNEAGTYLYLSTDQVRFYRIDDAQLTAHAGGGGYGAGWQRPVVADPLPLTEIPPLVFSEIMRDVDLFVGVASVGNDPAWADGGRRETERNAWAHFSFGDLSATAQTRRDLLQRLVPKLKIASRCSFEEKFLVVRGELRTYKIHLGSGNILMAPNDQYLCIVPGSSGKAEDGKVFLPFEGDRTLSVILSKAFLLAADAKITDPSITRQIGIASR